MKLKELTIFEFDTFAHNHPLGSYHQTSNYALFASEQNLDYELIGLIDEDNNIIAASLIIIKKLNLFYKYGYAPKGFLIDYYNEDTLKIFISLLKKRYYKQNIAFIKINPEIAVSQIINKHATPTSNIQIKDILTNNGFRELKSNNRFCSKIPKYNAILLLKEANLKTFNKRTRNKIHKTLNNHLYFEKGSREDIKIIYDFIKKKKNKTINHYFNYYNAFNKKNKIDIFLVKINFQKCLINLREKYETENNKNIKYVNNVMKNPSEDNLKKKLESDKRLNELKDNITEVTNYLSQKQEEYIAGAITIKYKNRINILISGFNSKYKTFNPNYFLHYNLIKYYQNDYDFLDLNGITGDFSNENPYKGLNEFKLGFNPKVFEYIGEFDLIINEGLYTSMEKKGILYKEFNRKEKILPKK